MAYDNTNSGVLFVETDKKAEKFPDYKGTINVEGKDYELAGWKRESKNGRTFLSLKISEPHKKKNAEPTITADLGDEIPF